MDNTKSVQLTVDEVEAVIQSHARHLVNRSSTYFIDRIKYLDKRLQDFPKNDEIKKENKKW